MGILSKLLGWDILKQEQRSREELERRKQEGFTAWHPEYGDVYYPPTEPAGPNEYNGYSSLNEPAYGDDDHFYT